MSNLYIGLMSGTSLDGIDAVLVDLSDTSSSPKLLASYSLPFAPEFQTSLKKFIQAEQISFQEFGEFDNQLGNLFAASVTNLLGKAQVNSNQVTAIGSHGQTIYHHPYQPNPFSLQIGDPNIIAAKTGITTVADFRRKDIALGGEGAPLAPAFHYEFLHNPEKNRAVVNIGGIANLTFLNRTNTVTGFDCGPGNLLLDGWINKQQGKLLDRDGEWAASGTVNQELLSALLAEPYFAKPPPKSSGRELFNLTWLEQRLSITERINPEDIQATLSELTATAIASALKKSSPETEELLICGGGVHNNDLFNRIQMILKNTSTCSTAAYGIDPDWLEAIAFAWLAKKRIDKESANLPSVTGAKKETLLGSIYQ